LLVVGENGAREEVTELTARWVNYVKESLPPFFFEYIRAPSIDAVSHAAAGSNHGLVSVGV
jgi:hypothetical protein